MNLINNAALTYTFVVDNLELEAEYGDTILVLQRLLHRVVVDVAVDQVQLQRVPWQYSVQCTVYSVHCTV